MKTTNGTITEYTLEERHAMLDASRNELKANKVENTEDIDIDDFYLDLEF